MYPQRNRYTSHNTYGYGYGYSYRRRKNLAWLDAILALAIVANAAYLIYYLWTHRETPNLPLLALETPAPTPTKSALSYAVEADDLYWAGEFQKSIAAYQQSLSLEPHRTDDYIALARLFIFEGRPERGLDMARAALRSDPNNAKAWALLGLAYDWLDLPAEAVAALEKAAEMDKTSPEIYAYLAEAQIDSGNWYQANLTMETAQKLAADNLDVLRDSGYVLENQGNYTGAIDAYQRALKIHPYFPNLYISIARNSQAMGNYTLAEETLKQGIDALPNYAGMLDMLGYTYLLQGNPTDAATYLQQALDAEPNNWRAKGHQATLYFQERNYEDAIPSYRQSIQYGEAERRRRVVYLVVTREPSGAVPDSPSGSEVARGNFAHPTALESPLRTVITGTQDYPTVRGRAKLDVMNGHYAIQLEGLAQLPPGEVYIAWFIPLKTVQQTTVHTGGLTPTSDGRISIEENTGAVKGPPIEHYYTLALSYYFLDQCDQAMPYIQTALQMAPDDANAQQIYNLCTEP